MEFSQWHNFKKIQARRLAFDSNYQYHFAQDPKVAEFKPSKTLKPLEDLYKWDNFQTL